MTVIARYCTFALLALMILDGCSLIHKIGPVRAPMVRDSETGIQFGATVDNTIFTDPAIFSNRRIKVTIRNTSGDPLFNLDDFRSFIEQRFYKKGYEPSDGEDFGIKVDVIVTFSGQIQEERTVNAMTMGGGLIGGAAGYVYDRNIHGKKKVKQSWGMAAGFASGVSIGYLLGRYLAEETYIIEATIWVGLRHPEFKNKRIVTFSRSPKLVDYEYEENSFGKWRESLKVNAAVYAGGTAVPQRKIASEVRKRLASMVADVI